MKSLKIFTVLILVLQLLLLPCCSTYPPSIENVQISSNVSSNILNLRNSGNGNIETLRGDRIMKKGFLSTGEEYGYYTLNLSYKYADIDNTYNKIIAPYVLGLLFVFTPFLFGAPFELGTYKLTAKLDILDINKKVVRSYSESAYITKGAGLYYSGSSTNKASEYYSMLIRKIQREAVAESNVINEELRAAYQKNNTAKRQNNIELALDNAAKDLMNQLKQKNLAGLKIAIVNISSQDNRQADFIAGELEHILLINNFKLVDRSQLDIIRKEQNLQLSGDVDDAQIVSVGKFSGANIVITGSVTGSGSMRRLRLRALDATTADVRAMSSEQF